MKNVKEYLSLVATAIKDSTEANINAVDAFESAHPEVVDASYQSLGKVEYDVVNLTVHPAS